MGPMGAALSVLPAAAPAPAPAPAPMLVADLAELSARRAECEQRAQQEQQTQDPRCPTSWDVVVCWPPTPAGRTAWAPCPEYILDFDPQGEASRQCSHDGTWLESVNGSRDWTYTNFSQCYMGDDFVNASATSVMTVWVPVVKRVAQLGYSVSLCTLVLAFLVLCSIKKLRCPRNNLHLHLFASFMLRAAMALLKDALFVRGVGLPGDVRIDGGELSFIEGRSNWKCKLITSLWQYSIMANYTWILMEGLYLHNLIFLAPFSDNSAITLYVALGWGLPASVVLPWVVGKRMLDDKLCWNVSNHDAVYYLLRVPTIATVLLSFALFVNIARVLLVKMQASIQVQQRGMRYRRWARSTMVLVPLFGTHYALFLVFSVSMGRHEVLEIVWLMLDQTFASFQGCLVALLYCLLTREVRLEVRRRWSSKRATWSGRHGSSRRAGSLLQSGPTLPSGPTAHSAHTLSKPAGRRASMRSNDLPCQISGRLELEGLPEEIIDNGILLDAKNKEIEAQSLASMGIAVGLRTKVCSPAGDAQSWV